MLSNALLGTYLGKSIAEICPHGYDSPADNHCAHFVSHVLQIGVGVTCGVMKGRPGGANLRVQELFPLCPARGEVLACPTTGEGLIFVSDHRNFRGTPSRIENVPRKHVGILLNGAVWHYSNSRQQVVSQTAGEFLFHYPNQQNALWAGSLPAQCRPTVFGTCT